MDCPVCLDDDIEHRACVLRCGHRLCNKCITQLHKPICPTCRAPMYPDAERPVPDHEALDPAFFRNPDLMDAESSARRAAVHHENDDEAYARLLADLDAPPLPAATTTAGSTRRQPTTIAEVGNLAHFQRQFSTLTYSLLVPSSRPPSAPR